MAHLGWWTWGSPPGGQVPADGEELCRTTKIKHLDINRTEAMAVPPIFPLPFDRAPPQKPRNHWHLPLQFLNKDIQGTLLPSTVSKAPSRTN